jgi:hypothetical protein
MNRPDQEPYESPRVEELPAEDGPAVTAAGDTPQTDRGPEWQPDEHADSRDS